MNTILRNGIAGAVFALASALAMSGASAQCVGSCGTSGANGVVTAPPIGPSTYNWISTNGGQTGVGSLGLGSETNGSTLTVPITVNAGDDLNFYFNYVTSDGQQYIEYAFAKLAPVGPGAEIVLFTARTTTSGNTVPGNGLPPIAATITPASTPIIGGGPAWSPLGNSSGLCYGAGCGYTGWVQSFYEIVNGGQYNLIFGVVNWLDTAYDSGMAIAGLTINDVPVPIGETPIPGALPLFATGLGALGFVMHRRRKKLAA